jgi:hypothetical protein
VSDAEHFACKLREEEKRARAMAPLSWEQIAEMLTWAESQLPVDRQRNRPRTHLANESV